MPVLFKKKENMYFVLINSVLLNLFMFLDLVLEYL